MAKYTNKLLLVLLIVLCSSNAISDDHIIIATLDGKYQEYVDGYFVVGKKYKNNKRRSHLYTPQVNTDYVEHGIASWDGPGFHGKKTANGSQYDAYSKYTAAHTTLPLPSVVKVTNLENGKAIEVVVNDRGPYPSVKGKYKSKRNY